MALSRHHAAFSKPLSVEEIVREAQNFEYNTHRPLQQWLRAARMLLTEAAICEQEGNFSQAYLYLYRHAELVLAKLPEHPDYKNPRFKPELSTARKSVQRNLVKLEQWKPRINQEHQRYVKAMERRNAERQRVQEEFNEASRQHYSYDGSRRGSLASQGSMSPTRLDVNEHREFAVNLAQQEIRRRDASRRSTHEAGISPTTVAQRRQGIVNEDDYFGKIDDGTREANSYFQQQEQASRARDQAVPSSSRRQSSATVTHQYHYPSVPQKQTRRDWDDAPPSRPISHHSPYNTQKPPPVPAKQSHQDSPPPVPTRPHHQPPTPQSKYTFAPTAYTESGAPLRTVLLPPDLRQSFLNLADSNTARNLETCGILAATVISGALFITHLILPDQTSTSDTCDTTPEGDNALFDYCDTHNLLVCGWIHTHPSQSCFLSSRDLHTSSGYQVMLPEAVAIVCSPRHVPEWGIFRLTEPPGLEHVLNCTRPGIFHPHEERNLYTDALRPGHVVEGPGLGFEVVDLRR